MIADGHRVSLTGTLPARRLVMTRTDVTDIWWRNAIVYCVDVETFQDSDEDGIGDFPGLTSRVRYLAGLGVTCIWLMPFYRSPNRDNGYDVSDFYQLDARLGTLGDVVEFTRTAREYGIRVIADLVVNHTSDEHPWFQAARRDPSSPYRDYYVWADEKPANADHGMVFPGVEDSVWDYDREAGQWFLHRFYRFQPDLNIANPAVRAEIKRIIGFWMELGLSGFRVDAVPFLIEQVGVENPAVADPHDYLRDLRAFLSRRAGDAILLAEANEPVERLAHFFGDQFGDQMHVLFNFVGNQALYLSLVRADASPLRRALRSLPPVPPAGAWANFVRNHDELSLDKLSDAERKEAFAALAPDPDMRLFGRGIRRRLPPMVDGDRRRVELAYSLAFSMPGTPVMFYGEEIGMGDDQGQPGRSAVRTPMQWSSGPTAGFSRAPAEALVRPSIQGGPFGADAVNVEDQRRDPRSLLNWFERLIRSRKEWPELGWGEWRDVPTHRRAVLAIETRWKGGSVVAIHNFGPRRARISLDLPAPDGMLWHHILGSEPHDPQGAAGIETTLAPYGYHWFGSRAHG